MSVETDSVRLYMRHSQVPHRVTSTVRPGARSYHGRQGTGGLGLAVDIAGLTPGRDSPPLRAIYEALEPLGPSCAELIYSGPGGGYWRAGHRVAPYAETTHHDHVHIAMPFGWSWTPNTEPDEVPVPDDPNLPNITGPIGLSTITAADGTLRGYVVWSQTTGEVHVYGDPAYVRYWGRSEIVR